DLVRMFERVPSFARDDVQFPDYYFLFVETFVAVDHQNNLVWLVFAPSPDRLASETWDSLLHEGRTRLSELKAKVKGADFVRRTMPDGMSGFCIEGEQTASDYMNRVQECQHYIAAGEIYQANLSHRFQVKGLPQ